MSQGEASQSWDDRRRTLRHELRTPLNHILSYAELASEDAEGCGLERIVDELDAVATAGKAALKLIDALLEARPDPNASQPNTVRSELAELIEDVTRRISRTSEDPEVQATPAIVADLEQIRSAAGRLLALVARETGPADVRPLGEGG